MQKARFDLSFILSSALLYTLQNVNNRDDLSIFHCHRHCDWYFVVGARRLM